ncbi:hypothetical protein GCM10023350_09110 [Nocardioides endophyticus]|uniref:MBL fold metallo-hydrolase n=1 Tax=Nocardioides endophyticus TaxID=1353775 RepID=A0ABP8YGU8_9ACTN
MTLSATQPPSERERLTIARPDSAASPFTAIDVLQPARDIDGGYGARLRALRTAAADFKSEFLTTGKPDYVETFDLTGVPYPTKFGLWRAAVTPAPLLKITNRLTVIRWTETGGRVRTLLFEPSDGRLGANTPYLVKLYNSLPKQIRDREITTHATVKSVLANLGIKPQDVDYLAFDHLHTQDVRRWIGTTTPQPDLSPDAPVEPYFPNAKLLVQRYELEAMADLHPLQVPWYQPETYRDLRPEGLLPLDGDVLLGPGVAFLSTPGHAYGNHSLVLNTDTGVWVMSENVIAAEAMTPEHSKIPGLARWARSIGQEVILNANTIETTAEQYNSIIIEKAIADPAQADPRFLQFFPTSELTGLFLNPGTKPTFSHLHLKHGQF